MPLPLRVRALSYEEEYRLGYSVRGGDIFALRRAQILLGSAQGQSVASLARLVGCSPQNVRLVIHAFHNEGLACLVRQSNRPKSTAPVLSPSHLVLLGQLIEQSPRHFGKERSLWSLALLAEVAFEQGVTPHLVSDETIRRALKRLKIGWKRAKSWISSPDAHYGLKKSGGNV